MISLGLNPFINCQGFGNMGMMTVLIGAVLNIILDPLFIFGMHMGVKGAALATILSQICSVIWVLRFLTGKRVTLQLNRAATRLKMETCKRYHGAWYFWFYDAVYQWSGADFL